MALDAARVALRRGAAEVTVVMLEAPEEAPASPWELVEAREEGVVFLHRKGIAAILAEAGRATGLALKDCLRVFDENRRFAPVFDPACRLVERSADLVITAIGQRPDLAFLGTGHGLALSPRGTLQADPLTLATSLPGVFAGGDAVSGPGIAIGAVAAPISYYAIKFRQAKGLDESLDVWACHGMAGTWGALATGLFALKEVGGTDGLFYGNPGQLGIQALSVAVTMGYAFVITFVLAKILGGLMGLRVHPLAEEIGLDLSEHGERAYS